MNVGEQADELTNQTTSQLPGGVLRKERLLVRLCERSAC